MTRNSVAQSTSPSFAGLHVAIIMDGNGRWAQEQGRERTFGHRMGLRAVRRVVECAPGLGTGTLTLYAFSSDNWARPANEVAHLMGILERYLRADLSQCRQRGVRINFIGRRDRLSHELRTALRRAEESTRSCRRLHLRIAVDYSSRDSILKAVASTQRPTVDRNSFSAQLNRVIHSSPAAPEVDLLIRTGGTQRLSDFLLWECAYAELYFTSLKWPDFGEPDLRRAVEEFYARERRFGQLAVRYPSEPKARVSPRRKVFF